MSTKNGASLPDYEKLFEEEAEKKSGSLGVIGKLLKKNSLRILLSTLMFGGKDIINVFSPLVTANIINALDSREDNVWTLVLKNAIFLIALYIIHIPSHVLYSKYTDNMLRTISAGLRRTLIR